MEGSQLGLQASLSKSLVNDDAGCQCTDIIYSLVGLSWFEGWLHRVALIKLKMLI